MITYARREESDDEARLEEKSSHESSLSLSRFGSEKAPEDDEVSESADTSGLDYASLPRVLLKGDKLQCKCGSWNRVSSTQGEFCDFERDGGRRGVAARCE